jgi:hypothetical protein
MCHLTDHWLVNTQQIISTPSNIALRQGKTELGKYYGVFEGTFVLKCLDESNTYVKDADILF